MLVLPIVNEIITERRRRWSTLLHTLNYPQLITEVLSCELPKYQNSSVIDVSRLSEIYRECMLILASAPRIFSAAVDGDLTVKFLIDDDLQAEYAVIQQRSQTQPSIYVQFLADQHGIAPSAEQYMAIGNVATQYTSTRPSHHELANMLDSILPPCPSLKMSAQGHRKYLSTPSSPCSPTRIANIHVFTEAIQQRWLSTPPSARNNPFPFPPSEVGYSIDSTSRLAQHSRHHSSNYIMNLTSCICTHLHRTQHPLFTGKHFTLHQFIIYLIFRPHQVRVAEIFCSGLLQSWIEGGTGFGYYPAGRSCSSAERVGGEEWEMFEEYARSRSALEEGWRVQREKIEEFIIGVGREVGRIWRNVFEEAEEVRV